MGTVRTFEDRDYPLFCAWREQRGLPAPDRSWLPATSFVYQGDVLRHGMISLCMDSTCGVGHIDWLTTRPGLSLAKAHEVVGALLAVVRETAKSSFPGRCVLIGCVQSPAMARSARRHGFTPTETVTMILGEVEPDQPWASFQSSPSSPPR